MKQFFRNIIVALLRLEATLMLKRHKPKIVAITGSVGKTSTKDAVYTVLSAYFSVRKSSKSFNSEIGVPLTILGLQNAWNNPIAWAINIVEGAFKIIVGGDYPNMLVVEVGADRKSDIKNVTKWLKPDVAVITKLSKVPVHVEFFASPKELIEEKGQLAKGIKKGGTLILNADDEDVMDFKKYPHGNLVTFGVDHEALLKGSNYKIVYVDNSESGTPTGITFKVDCDGSCIPVHVHGSIGRQHMYTALAALAAGYSQGINLVKGIEALDHHQTPPGRMKLADGMKESVIIDDTYNSSPIAVMEALFTMSDIKNTGKKIAVLGDMMELGEFSIEEHEKVGEMVAQTVDVFVAVGARMSKAYDVFTNEVHGTKQAFLAEDAAAAQVIVTSLVDAGDIVLVKGSQSMRLEKVVKSLMKNPEQAKDLLVRQEEEWSKR